MMGIISFLMVVLIVVLILIGFFFFVKVFVDDQKYISKIEDEFFEKGKLMTKAEIIKRIDELKEAKKEYKKEFGCLSNSLKIAGEKFGLKKALRALQDKG